MVSCQIRQKETHISHHETYSLKYTYYGARGDKARVLAPLKRYMRRTREGHEKDMRRRRTKFPLFLGAFAWSKRKNDLFLHIGYNMNGPHPFKDVVLIDVVNQGTDL